VVGGEDMVPATFLLLFLFYFDLLGGFPVGGQIEVDSLVSVFFTMFLESFYTYFALRDKKPPSIR